MIGRTLRALAHVGPKQLAAIVYRRIVPHSPPRRAVAPIVLRATFRSTPFLRLPGGDGDGYFTFLGKTMQRAGQMDWSGGDFPRLWRFHLHAFDWLRETQRDPMASLALIEDWISANPLGTPDAWAPYTVSRRIGNWVDLFAQPRSSQFVTDSMRYALAQHALWLETNLEIHLRANHYFENARALLIAGAYLAGADTARWRELGSRILKVEVDEQMLSDGGHIERSPMYHSLVLEGLLDLLAIDRQNEGLYSPALVATLRSAAARGLRFLAGLVLPDGEIPLFNDSAFGEAPRPSLLFDYGVRVGAWDGVPEPPALQSLAASGYYAFRDGDDQLIVDCGPLGAPYQSGHGHADTLSYEYVVGRRRLVTDAGVYGYEDDERRRYARSAGAHSTVTIDGTEPCELWGTFRVGRRARPIDPSIKTLGRRSARFVGAHDGFRHLPGAPLLRRTITRSSGSLDVVDDVAGKRAHDVISRITLAPNIRPVLTGDTILLFDDECQVALVRWAGDGIDVALERAERYPEFGAARESWVISLAVSGVLPLRIAYRIESSRALTP